MPSKFDDSYMYIKNIYNLGQAHLFVIFILIVVQENHCNKTAQKMHNSINWFTYKHNHINCGRIQSMAKVYIYTRAPTENANKKLLQGQLFC